MNSMLVCPHCNCAISRTTQTCPRCGEATGHCRSQSAGGQQYVAASQSVFTIVIDALRAPVGRRRPGPPPIVNIGGDS